MIICDKCGKDNQDHYKFCLGCGSELSSASSSPSIKKAPAPSKPAATPTSSPLAVSPTPPAGIAQLPHPLDPADMPETEPPEAAADDLQGDAPPPGMASCPSCGLHNPKEFIFCGSCGTRMHPLAPPRTSSLAAAKPASREIRSRGRLSLIRPDGSEGGSHPLNSPETLIGRGRGPLFDHDSYLSPTHARLVFDNNMLILEDAGSLNGVFVKISGEEPLQSGDVFRIGQELLRFDAILDPQILEDGTEIMGSPNPGYWGRLSVIMGPGVDGSAFPLMGEAMVLGRERGDILFSDDGYVSGTHSQISVNAEGYFLSDLGSSNGTFIRSTLPREIPTGSFILMGQQLFRIEYA